MVSPSRREIRWDQLRDDHRKTIDASMDLIAHARRMIQRSEEKVDSSDRLLRYRYPRVDSRPRRG
jgi:hypothetical protein